MTTQIKVSKVQRKGQVTIPVEIREKLGIEEGDLVAFIETENRVMLIPQAVVDAQALKKAEAALGERGFAFEEFMNLPQILTGKPLAEPEAISPEEGERIAEATAGIFGPRKQPLDFKELRRQFTDDAAENARSEMASDPA